MTIEIHLNNGMKFTADVAGYNGTEFTKQLNNPQVNHVNIGDLVLSKHAVVLVMPVQKHIETTE